MHGPHKSVKVLYVEMGEMFDSKRPRRFVINPKLFSVINIGSMYTRDGVCFQHMIVQ